MFIMSIFPYSQPGVYRLEMLKRSLKLESLAWNLPMLILVFWSGRLKQENVKSTELCWKCVMITVL